MTIWEDGDASAGVWECTPGPSRWLLETHEVIHLVAGRMTVTPDGGEPTEIVAGDVAVFPKGWSGTWDIHETVRKVYAIFWSRVSRRRRGRRPRRRRRDRRRAG